MSKAEEFIEEHISDALSAEIEEIWSRYSFFNFDLMQNVASLSKKEITEIAYHFTNWQKQQMMKDAIDGYVNQIEYPGSTLIILSENPNELKNGEDIKLIIFKED